MIPVASMGGIPWAEEHWRLFVQVPKNWRPPALIRSSVNSARDRITFVGVFTRLDDVRVKATTKARLDEAGLWRSCQEHLDMRLVYKMEPGL